MRSFVANAVFFHINLALACNYAPSYSKPRPVATTTSSPTTPNDPIDPTLSATTSESETSKDHSDYFFVKTKRTWQRSKDYCREKGGDLASFESPEKWKNVFEILTRIPYDFDSERSFGDNGFLDYKNNNESRAPKTANYREGNLEKVKNRIFWINGIFDLNLDTFQVNYRWDVQNKTPIPLQSAFWRKGYPRYRPYQGVFVMLETPLSKNSVNNSWGTWNLDSKFSSLCQVRPSARNLAINHPAITEDYATISAMNATVASIDVEMMKNLSADKYESDASSYDNDRAIGNSTRLNATNIPSIATTWNALVDLNQTQSNLLTNTDATSENELSDRNNVQYLYVETKRSWRDSQNHCRSRGGNLAAMETAEEWMKVFKKLIQLTKILDGRSSTTENGVGDDGGESSRREPRIFWIDGIYKLDLETFQLKYVWDAGKEDISSDSPFWRNGYPRQRPYQGVFVMLEAPSPSSSYNNAWGTWDLDATFSSLCEVKTNEQLGSSSFNLMNKDDLDNVSIHNSVFDLK